jgi:hypothetical protein
MRELFGWLATFEAAEASGQKTGLSERLHRICAPSPLDFDGTIVRVIDAKQEIYPFGTLPGKLSVLAWPSAASSGQSLEDQAIAAQLGAVLTLATNRRVEVAASDVPLTMEKTTWRTFLPTSSLLDRSLLAPLPDDPRQEFDRALRLLYGLPGPDREAIGAAVELHYTATLLFDVEPNAAYAITIAGIERLSRAYGSASADWSDWERAEHFDRLFDAIDLGEDQKLRLREELLNDRHLRLRQTFARYVVSGLASGFWELELDDYAPALTMAPDGVANFSRMIAQPPIPISRLVPRDSDTLRRRLLRSYDARSSYVHAGARRSGATSTAAQLVGRDAEPTAPVEFAGLRAILRALIFSELTARSQNGGFPKLTWLHPGSPPINTQS